MEGLKHGLAMPYPLVKRLKHVALVTQATSTQQWAPPPASPTSSIFIVLFFFIQSPVKTLPYQLHKSAQTLP